MVWLDIPTPAMSLWKKLDSHPNFLKSPFIFFNLFMIWLNVFSNYINETDVMVNLIPSPDSLPLPESMLLAIWFCSLSHSNSKAYCPVPWLWVWPYDFDQYFGKDHVPFLNLDLKRPQMFSHVLLCFYHCYKRNTPGKPADSKRRMRSAWSWLTQPATPAKNNQPHLPTGTWAK